MARYLTRAPLRQSFPFAVSSKCSILNLSRTQYWLAIFSTILVEEHLIFRRGKWSNYNPDDYGSPEHLPLGVAAFFALACGIMGAVFGMATEWYVGIIGRKSTFRCFSSIPSADSCCCPVGDPVFGGDCGFELSCAFTAITYPIFRWIERKYESPTRMRTRDAGKDLTVEH